MSRDVVRQRLRASLFAAVLLSAVAHAAVVFAIASREPVGAPVAASASSAPSRLRVSLALPPAATVAPSPASEAVPLPRRASAARTGAAAAFAASAASPSSLERAAAASEVVDDPVDRGPKPLTYPVISLPPDDDPRRVGLVRLMLVVSSEGRVVKSVVTAATLSQDYVDRIAESFAAVRFEPASVHGLPRASWYEVVVDFTFDPEAGPTV